MVTNPNGSVAKSTTAVVGVVALVCSCTVRGAAPDPRDLPSVAEVASYEWGGLRVDLEPSPYPGDGRDALAGRSLPGTQVVYTAVSPEPGPAQVHDFVATLFRAPTERAAREFWRDHPPVTTYHTLTSLMHRSPAERKEAERLGRHEVSGTRQDEQWSAVCFSPLQIYSRASCGDYLVWVQWCSSILELRISTTDRPYRTAEVDRTLRAIVGDIRNRTRC